MPFPDEVQPVTVVEYRAQWPTEFGQLSRTIEGAVGDLVLFVDHIGSTSVPGMPAKDCIDMQLRVLMLDEPGLEHQLESIGFRRRREPWNQQELSYGQWCRKLVFAPPAGSRSCNIHVREHGSPNARFALLFRDYLRANDTARQAWGAFKQRLALSVHDLADYGQIKAPATQVLIAGAEQWAQRTGWSVELAH